MPGNKVAFAAASYRTHKARGFDMRISEQDLQYFVANHDNHCEICGKAIDWNQKAANRKGPMAPTIDVFGGERVMEMSHIRMVHYRCNVTRPDAGDVVDRWHNGKI
jgi:hypothetical protein